MGLNQAPVNGGSDCARGSQRSFHLIADAHEWTHELLLSPSTIQRSHSQGRGREAERERGREGDRERATEGESARARGEGREGALATLEYHLSFYVLRYTATCVTVSFASKVVLSGDWPVRKT